MRNPTLVIMIDGISADYFREHGAKMPHLSQLAERGTYFQRMSPESCGTSLPGRASMLTGRPSEEHGIYGNMIWDQQINGFRYASPADIKVSSVLHEAKKQGLDVAGIGFGMIKPEDCSLYEPPYWLKSFTQRDRFNQSIDLSSGWKAASERIDDGRLAALKEFLDLPSDWPSFPSDDPAQQSYHELALDSDMLRLVSALVTSDDVPDLIFAEINFTNSIQHKTGYNSASSHWAAEMADTLIARLLLNLWASGMDDQFNLAICSDHGHAPVEIALYIDNIEPGIECVTEGGMLLVNRSSVKQLDQLQASLVEYGVELEDNGFLPEADREQLVVFSAPKGVAFELAPKNITATSGKPICRSSHGLRPGSPEDDRFAVFVGPEIDSQVIEHVDSTAFAMALRSLLKLD